MLGAVTNWQLTPNFGTSLEWIVLLLWADLTSQCVYLFHIRKSEVFGSESVYVEIWATFITNIWLLPDLNLNLNLSRSQVQLDEGESCLVSNEDWEQMPNLCQSFQLKPQVPHRLQGHLHYPHSPESRNSFLKEEEWQIGADAEPPPVLSTQTGSSGSPNQLITQRPAVQCPFILLKCLRNGRLPPFLPTLNYCPPLPPAFLLWRTRCWWL